MGCLRRTFSAVTILFMLLIPFLTGCRGTPAAVKEARAHVTNSVINYAKNQATLHKVKNQQFRQVARDKWDIKLQHQLSKDKAVFKSGKATADQFVERVEQQIAIRDLKHKQIDKKIQFAEAVEKKINKDAATALGIQATLAEYDETPTFTPAMIEGLLNQFGDSGILTPKKPPAK